MAGISDIFFFRTHHRSTRQARRHPESRSSATPAALKLIGLALAIILLPACGGKDAESTAQQTPQPSAVGRPNIVLLLFDDAGYSDMSAFGGEVQTPTIERIVREGVTVRRFYTTARCSPTRAGILTGNHPHDVGMADLAGPSFKTPYSAYQGQLPPAVPLVSELLRAAGYRTYMQGKWHLGSVPGAASDKDAPNLRGFDFFSGYLGEQAAPYPNLWVHPYRQNGAVIGVGKNWFSIAELNEATMAQLDDQFQSDAGSPFFLYFASQSPHFPLGAPPDLVDKYRKVYARPLEEVWADRVSRMRERGLFPADAPVNVPTFTAAEAADIREKAALRAAMIEATDAQFGRLVSLLEAQGKLDNTLIVVAFDNGAAAETSRLTNAPYRGAKGNLYEGGTISPLAARWPAGSLPANTLSDEITTYLDLMPTLLQAAEVAYPSQWGEGSALKPLAGRNLLPALRGEKLPPPENFYWNLYGKSAVLHRGRWKLLANSIYDEKRERAHAAPTLELYDLLSDPAETVNVVSEHGALAASLLADYEKWATQHGAVPFHQVLDSYRRTNAEYLKK